MGMTIRVELQDMKNDDAPFSAASTILSTCTLQPLQESKVLPIARLLISSEPWLTLNSSVEGIKRYLLRSDPALWRFAVYVGIDLAGVVCLRYPWLFRPVSRTHRPRASLQARRNRPRYHRLDGKGSGSGLIQHLDVGVFFQRSCADVLPEPRVRRNRPSEKPHQGRPVGNPASENPDARGRE